jgi:hypothetical protein
MKSHFTPKLRKPPYSNHSIEKLATRLEGVKRTGLGRFVAKCPSHPDKNPSLAVAEKEGRVLFHCFAGCEPTDILAAVGLTFSDLYPERPVYSKGQSTAAFNPYDVLKCVARETSIVALAAAQVSTGHPLTTADAERVVLAHERLRDAAQMMGVRL